MLQLHPESEVMVETVYVPAAEYRSEQDFSCQSFRHQKFRIQEIIFQLTLLLFCEINRTKRAGRGAVNDATGRRILLFIICAESDAPEFVTTINETVYVLLRHKYGVDSEQYLFHITKVPIPCCDMSFATMMVCICECDRLTGQPNLKIDPA